MLNKFQFFLFFYLPVTAHPFKILATPRVPIVYTVSFPSPETHEIQVKMVLTGIHQSHLLLKMPVWTPGSYLIREFSKNVETLKAEHEDQSLQVHKVAKNEWAVYTPHMHTVIITYTVYAFERSAQNSFADISHAFLSNPGIFIYPSGMLSAPSTVHILPYKNWTTVSTSLDPIKGASNTFFAPNYNVLFDSPFEIGSQDLVNFKVENTNYQLAIYGSGNYSKQRMTKDLTRVIEKQTDIFGENPTRNYLFILHNNQVLTGDGLEHLNSSVIELARDMFTDSTLYHIFLNVMAHEHLHLWNGKRLRPIALGPFNYDRENYTGDLWIVEGFTRYYENATVYRTKLFSVNDYLHELSQNISFVVNQSGLPYESLADASFDAWIKLYRHNENSVNSTINYYNQGALVAMLLDLEIKHDSHGAYRLDDAMRYMYDRYEKKLHRGYTDAEFRAGLEKFTNKSLVRFYKKYVTGTVAIDIDHYLNFAGYKLVDENAGTNNPWVGTYPEPINGNLRINELVRNSSFYQAGLNVTDIITAIDNSPVADLSAAVKNKKPGDEIGVTALRDGLPMTFKVKLLRRPYVQYHIESEADLTTEQIATRKKWLE